MDIGECMLHSGRVFTYEAHVPRNQDLWRVSLSSPYLMTKHLSRSRTHITTHTYGIHIRTLNNPGTRHTVSPRSFSPSLVSLSAFLPFPPHLTS
jgi:hypothetical protein